MTKAAQMAARHDTMDPRGNTGGMGGPVCIGPFIGELAYEFMDAGVARKLSRKHTPVCVVTIPDRTAFHEDYSTEIIAHNLQCVGAGSRATTETHPTLEELREWVPQGYRWIRQNELGGEYLRQGEYIVYGQNVPEWAGAIILHARDRDYCRNRDWTRPNWHRLGRWLAREFPQNRLVCIGSMSESHAIEGCHDLRGIPIRDTMNVLHSAWVFIGQSSGPAHLASHCGLSHIIWCEGGTDALYRERWNPHKTWVRARVFEGDPHKPSFEAVRDYVMESLGELRKDAA